MQPLAIAACVPLITIPLFAIANLLNLQALLRSYAADQMVVLQSILHLLCSDPNLFLLLILTLRYYRLVIHLIAYLIVYRADEVPANPTVTVDDVHVVISTVDPTNHAFTKCVRSILENKPRWLTVAVGGEKHLPATYTVLDIVRRYHGSTEVRAVSIPGNQGDKRKQMTMILDQLAAKREDNKDTIVVFVDDHAWWNNNTFLKHLLAPFENPKVGLVGTKKRVERERGSTSILSILNFLACIYLERHNFEITAQNAIDGGAFVISARTCAVRASIVMDEEFRDGFTNEYFFFGQFGPLRPDDDNYITRYVVRKGFETKFQNHPLAIMHTTLGVDGETHLAKIKKFHGQLLRWARSQWRSNTASLFSDRSIWRKQWLWTAHAGLITSLINFALVWDALIVYAWLQSNFDDFTKYQLAAIIIGSKMVKLVEFFWHNPQDLVLFPLYVLFAYVHTFYKLWALVTFWDHRWTGRPTNVVTDVGADNDDDDDDNGNDDNDSVSSHHLSEKSSLLHDLHQSATDATVQDFTGNSGPNNPPGGFFAPSNAYYQEATVESALASPNFPDTPQPTGVLSPVPSSTSLSWSRSSSVSSNNSFTERYGKNPMTIGQPNLFTPWGTVNTASAHLTPANVRESSQSRTCNLRRSSRSPSPLHTFKSQPTDTCRAPSYTFSSSFPSSSSSSSSVSSRGRSSDPFFGASFLRTTEEFLRSPAPSPSWVPNTSCANARISLLSLQGKNIIAAPVVSPPSPPYQPYDVPAMDSFHTRRQSEACMHVKVTSPQVIPRTNFTTRMPTPPASNEVEIVFKKHRTPYPSPASASGTRSCCDAQSTKRRTSPEYRREFVRGDDCGRVHGDGSHLIPGSMGSCKRCRSPEPRDAVVRGRRY